MEDFLNAYRQSSSEYPIFHLLFSFWVGKVLCSGTEVSKDPQQSQVP